MDDDDERRRQGVGFAAVSTPAGARCVGLTAWSPLASWRRQVPLVILAWLFTSCGWFSPLPLRAQAGKRASGICQSRELRASAYVASGAGGQESVVVVLRNVGTGRCTMDGYPIARWVLAGGTLVGRPSMANQLLLPRSVLLGPDGAASTTLWTASPGYQDASLCRPTNIDGVRVTPPGQSASLFSPVDVAVCVGSAADVAEATPIVAGDLATLF